MLWAGVSGWTGVSVFADVQVQLGKEGEGTGEQTGDESHWCQHVPKPTPGGE